MAIKPAAGKGSGRGGKRVGAGPKTVPRAPLVEPAPIQDDGALSVTELARRHVGLALQTLVNVSGQGASEAARVAAAKVILEHASGKSGGEQPLGKKQEREQRAKQIATGRLATPQPPKLVVNNGS